ncbi:MAG: aspartate carbamoyltransferase regulatory subunit [Clostridiales bacterium]|nr:aspartate carbamoyltransferase regulatory subunit [Clostridiales bacterium]MDD7035339.1 aspartate carbamoyltransferase regulatory subunit [Bacillota bacterium]MDY2920554.1 aspartate carbamoyltransferase regulatory subunit [Lentihominibacter sp.]
MIIGKIKDGIVLDHIQAGKGMDIYNLLNLSKLDCQVALIKNAESKKMGKKDILKIDRLIDMNLDVIGYVDPGVTVNYIEDGKLVKRKHLELPEEITGVIKCKNPRCITTIEQELPHVFRLVDREKKIYRCIYCETQGSNI